MKLIRVSFTYWDKKPGICVFSFDVIETNKTYKSVESGTQFKKENENKIAYDGVYYEIIKDNKTTEKDVVQRFFKVFSKLPVSYYS